MPATGNLNQENPPDSEGTENVPDKKEKSPNNVEVSSTTELSEFEKFVRDSTKGEQTVESSSMEVSDSLDGLKGGSLSPFAEESKIDSAKANVQTGAASTTSTFNNGFQSAFAAFASASATYSQTQNNENISETSVDGCNSDSVDPSSTGTEAVGSSTEPVVSSAIDSSLVTTSGETVSRDTVESSAPSDSSILTEAASQQQSAMETEEAPSEPQVAQPTIEEIAQPEQAAINESVTQSEDPAQTTAEGVPQSSVEQSQPAESQEVVYFIQGEDASGEIVTSIIDPADIAAYAHTTVYKQCYVNGEVETTIVSAPPEEQPQQQIIYAHDANGVLSPIDSAASASDVAPPGKQFVYMQDSSGRIIRTVMDASQEMVPGQQVYYTQSEDGQIITSLMDSSGAAAQLESEASQNQQVRLAYFIF